MAEGRRQSLISAADEHRTLDTGGAIRQSYEGSQEVGVQTVTLPESGGYKARSALQLRSDSRKYSRQSPRHVGTF